MRDRPARILNSLVLLGCSALPGCSATSLDRLDSGLGQATTWASMTAVIDQPGPIEFKKHLSAHWAVELSGLLNLHHELAQAAGLNDRVEPIEIYTYTIRHPERGIFLVDSGISENLRAPGDSGDIAWVIRRFMNTAALSVERTTRELSLELDAEIAGVFLTHIHLDHILGLSDLAPGTPVYVGPGEGATTTLENLVTQGTTDRLLANAGALNEWQFDSTGVIDVFGDASVFAIHAPGHTAGSTVYLVRTTDGPELLLGDTCHTAWGWHHGVEPGTFSDDQPASAASLRKLLEFASAHPALRVHPGHQRLTADDVPGFD